MLFLIVLVATFVPATLQAQACESLSKLVSPTVLITLAKTIDAGAFTPTGSTTMLPDLPAFCRVAANLKPTPDSDIRAEIWLPISGWNGKFVAVGNGGWGGSISSTAYDDMADALRRGYATSATDDGHTARGASFILGHPEKFIDFAYRAEREMTVEAKSFALPSDAQTICSASQTTAEFELCVVGLRTQFGNKMGTASPKHPLRPRYVT
jgi:feruloyl esterase